MKNFFTGERKNYADPFFLTSAENFPTDIHSSYDLCLYLYGRNSLYASAMSRLFTYFMPGFKLEGTDPSSKNGKKLLDIIKRSIRLMPFIQRVGVEWAIYGNAFVRFVEPFDRYLIDERGGSFSIHAITSYPEHTVTYDYSTMTYNVPDLRAAENSKVSYSEVPKIDLTFIDKPSQDPANISLILLDPRYVDLDSAHHGNSKQVIYTPPPEMVQRVKDGNLNEVNNTPRALLQAIKDDADYLFFDGEVFHFVAPTPSGISESGLGCPNLLWFLEDIFKLQIYRAADAAIAQELINPMRVFTPNLNAVGGDITQLALMSTFQQEMKALVARHRKDPRSIHVLPFEVSYQEYGGNAKNFTTYEQVKLGTDDFLDGIGIPRELFRGSMSNDQIPTAVKMMENQFVWLIDTIAALTEFVSVKAAAAYDLGGIYVTMQRPSMAYDVEYMQLRMRMAANREMPREAVYKDVGIDDPIEAAVDAVKEDHEIQRRVGIENQKQNKAMTQGSMADVAIQASEQGAGGAPQQGAAGGGGGGGLDYAMKPGEDPLAIQQRAEEIAMQWLTMHAQQPNSHRNEMRNAEAVNPTLYAAAKNSMEKQRAQGASQGRASVGQQ